MALLLPPVIALIAAAGLVFAPGVAERLGPIDLYMLTLLATILLMLLVVTGDGMSKVGWQGMTFRRAALISLLIFATVHLYSARSCQDDARLRL